MGVVGWDNLHDTVHCNQSLLLVRDPEDSPVAGEAAEGTEDNSCRSFEAVPGQRRRWEEGLRENASGGLRRGSVEPERTGSVAVVGLLVHGLLRHLRCTARFEGRDRNDEEGARAKGQYSFCLDDDEFLVNTD